MHAWVYTHTHTPSFSLFVFFFSLFIFLSSFFYLFSAPLAISFHLFPLSSHLMFPVNHSPHPTLPLNHSPHPSLPLNHSPHLIVSLLSPSLPLPLPLRPPCLSPTLPTAHAYLSRCRAFIRAGRRRRWTLYITVH